MDYKYKIDIKKIKQVKDDLGYSSKAQFAIDCWVSKPTVIAIFKTKTSGMKFLRGISDLSFKNKNRTTARKPLEFTIE